MAGKVSQDGVTVESVAVNEVRLVGRVSREPEERQLPSGDVVWTFRLVVPRPAGRKTRQSVDAIDCAVWGGRVRQQVAGWGPDDLVEVSGSLRRRFFAAGGGRTSRVEIEVASGRIVKRAAPAPRGASA